MDAKQPTIWNSLTIKLGRQPTTAEAIDDVKRILQEATLERAQQGKLRPQRKR